MQRRLFLGAATAAMAQQKLPVDQFEPKSMLTAARTPMKGPLFPSLIFMPI
jgi:hypothetical protein